MTGLPKAVIYDWDNTLVDTWPVIIAAMNETLTAMGQATWTDAEAKERIRKSLRESFPDLFGDRWLDAKDVFYDSITRNHLRNLSVLEGAEGLTSWFVAQGIPQFVLSNKTDALLQAEVHHLGWRERFQHVVGADVAPKDKPAPEAITHTLMGSGLTPSAEIWFIGDTAIDMQCAHLSRLTPIAIRPMVPNDPEWETWAPTQQFNTPRTLLDYLNKKLT